MTGWRKSFLRASTGARAETLREIYGQCSAEERRCSPEFCDRYGTGDRTPFEGIRTGPGPLAGMDGVPTEPGDVETLRRRLSHALAASLPDEAEVAVAVSGGIDSWLLAALLQSMGYRVRGWYLESGISGYCERDRVESLAAQLQIACRHIRVTQRDFVRAIPAFLAATETPIYNLHPVSKLLLARGLRERGIATVVSGDGADQVMRREWHCDLLPLTISCFQAAGVRLVAPFLAEGVVSLCRLPDPEKRLVRELAAELGVPSLEKHPTLFPPVPLEGAQTCLAYTTGLLIASMEAPVPCAASQA